MNKSSQNVQNLVFFRKNLWVFRKKNWLFQKPLKIKIIVVGCNWISKISQNVEKVASSWKKKIGFSKKNFEFFLQTAKSNRFDAECNRLCKISQNVQELVFFWKKIDWVFEKILGFFRIARRSKVALQGHWKSKNSQNFRKLGVFFRKWMGSFEKKSYFLKKVIKVANSLQNATKIISFLKTFKF